VSKLLIALLTTVTLLAFAGIRLADFWEWRAQTLNAAEARAANLSSILSEYIREMFAAGDTSLRQLAVHSRRVGGPEAPESEWMPSLTSATAGSGSAWRLSVTSSSSTAGRSSPRARAKVMAPRSACGWR
jgi:hypothetical protein